jgi:hypothetical protein
MSNGGSSGMPRSADSAYGVDDPPDELKQRRGSRVHPEEVEDAVTVDSWKQTKLKMWTLFENPQSSRAAFILSVVLLVLILISCVAFCLQTIPEFYAGPQEYWDAIELVCIVCFSIEYISRLVASPHRMSFCAAPLNIIDLVAIAPFYIEKIAKHVSSTGDVSGLAVFRIIRLARVFRLFKLGRYSDGLKTFANTMARSTRPLAMLVFFMIIAIILFSSAIYYCERGAWDEAQREWWRDQEDPVGTFEMVTVCNGTVTSAEGTGFVPAMETADFEKGSQTGWVPKLASDYVDFPTGYIVEGSGIAFRTRGGTFTATYTDNRAAGDPSVTAEDVQTAITLASEWGVATCAAYPVESDDEPVTSSAWAPTGEAESCVGGNTYTDGMAANLDDENTREVFPAAGETSIENDLKQRMALAIASQLPATGPGAAAEYSVTLEIETHCREVGCLYCTEPSPFNSIPASFYWAAVTMTTVGYGDVFPTTTAGQFVASLTMMVGILILALPITVIGTYFAAEYEEYLRRQVRKCTHSPEPPVLCLRPCLVLCTIAHSVTDDLAAVAPAATENRRGLSRALDQAAATCCLEPRRCRQPWTWRHHVQCRG